MDANANPNPEPLNVPLVPAVEPIGETGQPDHTAEVSALIGPRSHGVEGEFPGEAPLSTAAPQGGTASSLGMTAVARAVSEQRRSRTLSSPI